MTILHVAADAPQWVQIAADTVLFLHIGGGAVGIVSGYAAMAFRKGETLHRIAGNVFTVGMLVMAVIGAAVSPLLPGQWLNSFGGLLTLYLVVTSWVTVKRPEGRVGRFERAAMAAILLCAVVLMFASVQVYNMPRHMSAGVPFVAPLVFGFISLLAAALDFSMIRRGGLYGVPRIARHLWRMSLALFIAAASFFLGQQQVMPAWMRGQPALFIPALAPLALLIFWQIRVRIGSAFKTVPPPALAAAE